MNKKVRIEKEIVIFPVRYSIFNFLDIYCQYLSETIYLEQIGRLLMKFHLLFFF